MAFREGSRRLRPRDATERRTWFLFEAARDADSSGR